MSEILQEFVMELLLKVVAYATPIIAVWFVNLLFSTWEKINSAKPKFADYVEDAANFAIAAAEKVGLSGALCDLADSKLDYALQIAEKWLAAQGITRIDLDLLRAKIEAALLEADYPHRPLA